MKTKKDVETIRQFRSTFKTDGKKYGYDGDAMNLDSCLCGIDIELFAKNNPKWNLSKSAGDWWED